METGGDQILNHRSIHTCYHILQTQRSINKCSWFNCTRKRLLLFPRTTNWLRLHCLNYTTIHWDMGQLLLHCLKRCVGLILFITTNSEINENKIEIENISIKYKYLSIEFKCICNTLRSNRIKFGTSITNEDENGNLLYFVMNLVCSNTSTALTSTTA